MHIQDVIDLRSDTVTQPTLAMRKVICDATVGDELYSDDPNTAQLEIYCAEYFGKEASLFLPSGMMANLIATRCHTVSGDTVLTDKNYHVYYYARSTLIDLARVSLTTIENSQGVITSDHLEQHYSTPKCYATDLYASLLWLENTISGLGGKIYPLEKMRQVYQTAKAMGLSVHLDGARLLNASVAEGVQPAAYCQCADTIMLTFTKGIGAPFGAVLMGDRDFIERATRFKKKFGGGMHQSGMMAAACKYALEKNIVYLQEDHRRAQLFAKLLIESKDIQLSIEMPETNMVIIDMSSFQMNTHSLVEQAKKSGLLLCLWGNDTVRAVFHRGISDYMVYNAVEIMQEIVHCLEVTV